MKKSLILLACAAALSICSCKKEDPAQIILKTKNIDCPAVAADYPINFTVNYDWTASSNVSWAKLSETAGVAGEVSIKLSVAEPDVNERSGLVIISCRDIRDTIKLNQSQLDKMVLNKHEVLLTSAGGKFDVTVGTNIPYEVKIPSACSWLKLDATKTYGDETVSFSCEANATYDDREAKVLFVSSNGKFSDTLKVHQSQFDKIMIKEHQVSMGSNGGSFTIVASSNVKFDVVIPSDINWLRRSTTKGLVDENVFFECDPNPLYDDRTASVFFTSQDGTMYDTLTVNQKQLDKLELLTGSLEFASAGNTVSVELETNVDYEYSVPESAPWLTVTKTEATKGLVKESFTVICAANEDYDPRSAQVVFRQVGGGVSDTLSVSQLQKDGLFASPDSVSVESAGGKFTVELKYNVEYEIASDADWLSWEEVPATKGLETKQYIFTAAEYSGTEQPRTASVTFKSGALVATIFVSQDPVKPSVLKFGSAYKTVSAPSVTGGEGFTGNVDWGDGSSEAYKAGTPHTYQNYGDHDITIVTYFSDKVTFGTVEGLNYIDFSAF